MRATDAPAPVAVALARLDAAVNAPQRIAAAADAIHAVVKYIALIRLAEWRESFADSPPPVVEALERILGAPSLDHWHRLAIVLGDHHSAWTPLAPQLRGLTQAVALASQGRLFRHFGLIPEDDPGRAVRLETAVEAVIEAAEPLLLLPLVAEAASGRTLLRGAEFAALEGSRLLVETPRGPLELDPFALVLEGDAGRRDIGLYERLLGEQLFYAAEGLVGDLTLAGRLYPRALPGRLRTLIEQVRAARIALSSRANAVSPTRFEEALARHFDQVASAATRGPVTRVPREPLEAALDTPNLDRPVVVFALTGPSGVGKTREAIAWLERERARGRTPVWLRGGLWRTAPFAAVLATQIGVVEGTPPTPAMLPPLSLVIDGLDEAAAPGQLLEAAVAWIRQAPNRPGALRVLLTAREEGLPTLSAGIPPDWWGSSGDRGRIAVGPLDATRARRLWRHAEAAGLPRFDALPVPTRRLAALPLFAALAIRAGASGLSGGIPSLLRAYVGATTGPAERALLRHVATRMWERRVDVLTEDCTEDDALAAALGGDPTLGPALERLRAAGLLEVAGAPAARLRFGVDRVAEWLVAEVLADRVADEAPHSPAWTRWFLEVRERAILTRAVAAAAALLHRNGVAPLDRLVASEDGPDRSIARLALLALAELDDAMARREVDRWWSADFRARTLILEIAPELGRADLFRSSLTTRRSRAHAVATLARANARARPFVLDALSHAWSEIERHPALHVPTLVAIGRALVQARVGDGGEGMADPAAVELTHRIARRLLGGEGWRSRVARRLLAHLFALSVRPMLRVRGTDAWADLPIEFAWFFRRSAEERRPLLPIVHLFEGELRPLEARHALLDVARRSEVLPTTLLQNALIARAADPATTDETFALVDEIGAAARAVRPVPMAAQSVLYVRSTWLFSHPAHPGWATQAARFREDLEAWLEVATNPPRRWTSSTGRHAKALFAAADLGLAHLRTGRWESDLVDRLWDKARRGDTLLQRDILDDAAILAASSGRPEGALALIGPLADLSNVSPDVLTQASTVMGAIAARAPDVASAWCDGPGPVRAHLRAAAAERPRDVSAELALSINFDERIVFASGLRPVVSRVLHHALVARSLHHFLTFTLLTAADWLMGAPPPGAPGTRPPAQP